MLKDFDQDLASLDLPDEVKQQILDKANERANGLVNKNSELLDKLDKNKNNFNASVSELERLKQFEQAALREQEEAKGNYQQALEMAKTESQKQVDQYQSQLQEKDSLLNKLLIEDGLNKALDAVNVNPSLKAGAEAMLRSKAQLTDGKAMIGEKSLSDAVKEWANSDTGKAFCLAPENSGGGANGTQQNSSASGKMTDFQKRLQAAGLKT